MKFSICIPTYNRPELIRIALSSALNQTVSAFEIVICDNSENSDTEAVVNSYSDFRIRYHRHEKNIGIAGNWNALLKMANGKYVKFLNDDDELLPTCIEDIENAIQSVKCDVGIVTCAAEYVDSHSVVLKRDRQNSKCIFQNYFAEAENVPLLWCYNAMPLRTPTHMTYHRQAALSAGGFKEDLDYTRDVHLALELASQYGGIVLDEKPLVRFRLHQGQDVKGISIETRLNDQILTKSFAYDMAKKYGASINKKSIVGEVCLREMALMLKLGRIKDAGVALNAWFKKGSLASLYHFVNNNLFSFRTFNPLYSNLSVKRNK